MRALSGLALGGACAAIVACAAAPSKTTPAMAPSSVGAPVESPRDEIKRLDGLIEQQLGGLGLTLPPPACAPACPAPTEQMSAGLVPPSSDATCKPGPSEQCKSSCGFADSICTNAKRICELAEQLGGADVYANEKCAHGTTSCEKSRDKCCGCL